MTNIRRYFSPGHVYFLTHVTYARKPILVKHADILWLALTEIKRKFPFEIIAWCILPDHFHILVNPEKTEISAVMRKIKLSFSNRFRISAGLARNRVWQNRFWDHQIRDENDLNRHLDYIHHNPVKHGLITAPIEYEYSSFKDFVHRGYYSAD
jgi:putative transposase